MVRKFNLVACIILNNTLCGCRFHPSKNFYENICPPATSYNYSEPTNTLVDKLMLVFGMPLGQSFRVKECSKHGEEGDVRYSSGQDSVCFERVISQSSCAPLKTGTVIINFPHHKAPEIATMSQFVGISGTIIDEKLEGIEFSTLGIQDADFVLSKLKEKYGNPTIYVPLKVKNYQGGTFDSFIAKWNFEKFTIFYSSVLESLDHGSVKIYTKKGTIYRNNITKKFSDEKTKI